MNMKHVRTAQLTDVVRRDGTETESALPGFRGHAAMFNQPTLIGSTRFGFVEQIAPGAFADVLDNDVRFLFNHDGQPMARTKNGTLRLSEDASGLEVQADFADTQLSRDQVELLTRGDLDQMSFAFSIEEETRSDYTGSVDAWRDLPMYTINKVRQLFDVATVTFPAYEGTDAGLRVARFVTDAEIRDRIGDPTPAVEHLPRPVLRQPPLLVPNRSQEG